MEKQASFIKINPADSVVVCLRNYQKGEIIEVDGKNVVLSEDVPVGHKVLIKDTAAGENIIKYGYPIGHAMTDLKAGQWVNENNLKKLRKDGHKKLSFTQNMFNHVTSMLVATFYPRFHISQF